MKTIAVRAVLVAAALVMAGSVYAQTKKLSGTTTTTKPVGDCPDGFVLDSYNRCVRAPR